MPGEERRNSRRIAVGFPATIRSGSRCYEGYLTDVSEHGIGYVITSLIQSAEVYFPKRFDDAEHSIGSLKSIADDFASGKIIELSFTIPSGDKVDLKCSLAWFLDDASKSNATIGMRITDNSPAFLQLMKDLDEEQSGFSRGK